MIRIACTNCKTILSIDDAFAGGVCRCQHCGTIQTVPAKEAAASGQVVGGAKSLYQNEARSGTGLTDLAGVVRQQRVVVRTINGPLEKTEHDRRVGGRRSGDCAAARGNYLYGDTIGAGTRRRRMAIRAVEQPGPPAVRQ